MKPSCGYIYLLGNHAMPGVYKIGRTNSSPARRAKQLSASSGVPLSFDLLYAVMVDHPLRAERLLHQSLAGCRINSRREFFRLGLGCGVTICSAGSMMFELPGRIQGADIGGRREYVDYMRRYESIHQRESEAG